MRVLITGATGLIGRHLVRSLLNRGDTVLPLSRKPLSLSVWGEEFASRCEPLRGDPQQAGAWLEAVGNADAVVHLAGEPIMAHRWSVAFLQRVRDSRVKSTRLISETLARSPRKEDGMPRVFICGSAVGYYGANSGDAPLDESAAPGTDAMAHIAREWEEATQPARDAGVRVCNVRTGIVLDPKEGALPRMVFPFKMFVGGRIGSGKQYMSWIHRDDMNALLMYVLDHAKIDGPFNATASHPVRNSDFSKILAKVLRRPNWLPVPRFALRIALGKVVQVVAGGQNALPKKLLNDGFVFQFPELEPALHDLLNAPSEKYS